MRGFRRAVLAELSKLRTLPAVPLAVLGTVVIAAAVSAAVVAQALETDAPRAEALESEAPRTPVAYALQTIPFIQLGVLLLGILPVAHEYAGRQLRTSLCAVPSRWALIAAKTVSTAAITALAAVLAVGAAWGTAALMLRGTATGALAWGSGSGSVSGSGPAGSGIDEGARIVGAVLYLVLIALFAHAVALLLAGMIPSLVAVLGLVLLLSPVLAGLSEHARWLPDRAAMQLYASSDPALGPGGGALVALVWVVVVLGLGALRFARAEP